MSYRRFKLPSRHATLATTATAATVSVSDLEVSQKLQLSQGVSCGDGLNRSQNVATVASTYTDLDDWRAAFDERAGVLEYDAGLPRQDAERQAWSETVALLGPCPPTIH